MDLQVLKVGEGSPIPMGATVEAGGVNFAVFSRNGTAVTFILFNNEKRREIALDVVFNHTAEGNELGPTISFKGFDNSIYYILNNNRRYYQNYSGCGNTLNCNNPIVRNLILDSMKYWVVEMHVDGLRFDLRSILGRDQWGNLMKIPRHWNSLSRSQFCVTQRLSQKRGTRVARMVSQLIVK
jgi:pullulanase/glycogen debranching enzyme